MAQKRPCEDYLPNGVSSKHLRLTGEGNHNVSHLDMVSVKEVSGKLCPSGEGSLMVNGLEGQDISANGRTPGFLYSNEEDIDAGLPRSLSLSPWAASSSSEEDHTHDHVAPLPFTTEYFSSDRSAISPFQANDLYYYSLLDYPPRKSVPIGPDHQADVPELSESSSIRDANNEFAGECVIPRKDLELPSYDRFSVGTGRTDCDCVDMGSVRCVRQHIMQARENLMTTLGQEAFVELGFCEMGEVEAEKWTKTEQQLFDKVVHCNPVSVGKKFWNVLFAVFPSRTKMEIVSYYFNVFMLQKRAEQNRYDPINIDSDNDEWQLSDDDDFDPDEDDGFGPDEEDSSVESPVCHNNDDGAYMCQFNDSNSPIDYPFDDLGIHSDVMSKFDCDPGIKLVENNVHDSSYTSSDSAGAIVELPPEITDCSKEWQDFILEPCDAKPWNGYSTCAKEQVDFLPTCSMIQEVFGDGSLEDVKRR